MRHAPTNLGVLLLALPTQLGGSAPPETAVDHVGDGGIPGLVSFRGVLLAYSGGLGTPGFVPVSRCTNGGALGRPCNWEKRAVNITAVTPYDTARDPQMLGDERTGLLWLAYGRDMTNKREKAGGWKQRGGMPWPFASSPTPRLDVMAVCSSDAGLSWGPPRNITQPVEGWPWPASAGSTGVGHGTMHSSGRILFPSYGAATLAPKAYPANFYPDHNRSYPEWMLQSSAWMRYSDDSGQSWHNSELFGAAPTFVSEKTTNGYCVEPEIVELFSPPGRLLANCRNQARLDACPNPGADPAVYAEGGCRVFFYSDDRG